MSRLTVNEFSINEDLINENRQTGKQPVFVGTNPVLPVRNVRNAVSFYTEVLGFKLDELYEDPQYARVSRGCAVIEFGAAPDGQAGTGICYIRVTDVDGLYEQLGKRAIEFVGDLNDRHYGGRDFRIRDEEGNMLIFGMPLVPDQPVYQHQAQGDDLFQERHVA